VFGWLLKPFKEGKQVKTIVLDLETIPDAAAMQRAAVEDDGSFPPWPLHALACASMLIVETDLGGRPTFSVASYSRATTSERGIVAAVERVVAGAHRVLTFNGRAFDLPVLMVRAAMTGEVVPTIAKLHAQRRFTAGLHVDLLEEATNYGTAPRIRLNQLCAAFSVPSKIDTEGSEVAALVAADEWDAVTDYCEQDVVCTYLAAQHWVAAERGDPALPLECWSHLARWIRSEQPRLRHLLAFASPPEAFLGGPALRQVEYSELGW